MVGGDVDISSLSSGHRIHHRNSYGFCWWYAELSILEGGAIIDTVREPIWGIAVVTSGFLVDRKALDVNRSKHNSPKTKYVIAHRPL